MVQGAGSAVRHAGYAALCLAFVTACAARQPPAIVPLAAAPCARAGGAGDGIAWYGPSAPRDRQLLTSWCESVGPVVVRSPREHVGERDASAGLVVSTWNVHEGRGDVDAFVRAFSAAHVVVLVQEAVHSATGAPARARDIEALADRVGMWLAYVPSMPNGRRSREDRGCAILSTLPLESPAAIELPWVRQRRVAVMATVAARDSERRRPLRFVCVHLDNRSGRKEQANALADWLRPIAATGDPLVVGGDFNSWFGANEETVQTIDRVVPLVRSCGGRASFRFGLHLDHLFATPSAAVADCAIAADAYGSDHHPVIGLLK
jgi:endonuclease/exonuclease/phosphatase family metal-dependent hydrolase